MGGYELANDSVKLEIIYKLVQIETFSRNPIGTAFETTSVCSLNQSWEGGLFFYGFWGLQAVKKKSI